MKTKILKALTLCLALLMCLGCALPAYAAEAADATIDMDAPCTLTIWKYDFTNAMKDGVWDNSSFTSTGYRESYVEDVLGNAIRKGDANGSMDNPLGNGQNANGYAIKGVGFTYLKVASIVAFTESENDQHPDYNLTQVLYGFNKTAAAPLLKAIGLEGGARRYENADTTDKLDHANWYYTSNTLNEAIANALAANATTVKDALESFIQAGGGTAMDLTDENGRTSAGNLPVGLYLMVETKVPEMVTSTVNPFFVSLPMTTVSGNAHSASPEGGHEWNYDVVVYPKNETGIPTLEKTVREAKNDTGKNGGSNSITDGYDHNATASAGDVLEYQIITTLPTITSQATALKTYSFYDTLGEGLSYRKAEKDVKIEFFTDKNCTAKVATWVQGDGKFTVSYSDNDSHMTVDIAQAGLDEINGKAENANGKLYAGYSNYTARVTYTAKLDSDATAVWGQEGNGNKVVLTWKRTSSEYYDTLIDDAHVYSFGLDLTKVFTGVDSAAAEKDGMFQHVKFKLYNETDGYWVTAARNDAEGVYYVNGHVAQEADASVFVPVVSDGKQGKVIVKGLEDDTYRLTEVETANGYTLLKEPIHITITASEDDTRPCDIYSQDVLGVLQNDPRYAFGDVALANIPQKQLRHEYLTASATVDGNKISMREDNGSANALSPLTIVNNKGFDLPQTGDQGTWMFGTFGVILMATAAFVVVTVLRKSKKEEKA